MSSGTQGVCVQREDGGDSHFRGGRSVILRRKYFLEVRLAFACFIVVLYFLESSGLFWSEKHPDDFSRSPKLKIFESILAC